MAIQSFADKETEKFYKAGRISKTTGWQSLVKIAARKLDILDYAVNLDDLKSPPGNKPEKLKGDLRGMHSIRINDQWHIVFRWTDGGPADVQIVDYHK